MKDGKPDISPTDAQEAELLRQINMVQQSSPSAARVALEIGDQRMPGFKKKFLEKAGIIEFPKKSREP